MNIRKETDSEKDNLSSFTTIDLKKQKKEARQAAKLTKRKAYQDLSFRKKALYWGMRVIGAVAVCGLVLIIGVFCMNPILTLVDEWYFDYCSQKPVSKEEIYSEVPIDTDGAEGIAALPTCHADDTWAFYIYMCGSDLESNHVNRLSDVTKYLIMPEAATYIQKTQEQMDTQFWQFVTDIREKGIDLPTNMYLPPAIEASKTTAGEFDEVVADMQPGYASADIDEILSVALPQNVKFIIQTGGASRWSSPEVNPNRSQRFVYDSKGFQTTENNPPQNMGEQETLIDFLNYCNKNFPADHKVLLFWNHGAGAFGVASDELYGQDSLSLSEMSAALGAVYEQNESEPPFELIGFDVCLMASVEVAHSLHGYGKYLAASEELEPGEGWDYAAWLEKFVNDTSMNGAQIGQIIADSYIDYYTEQAIRLKDFGIDFPCTFSITDIGKANEVYIRYGELVTAILRDIVQEPWIMSELGRASAQSVRYASDAYSVFNTIDLAVFMRELSEIYPAETQAVLDTLDETVLYNRASSYVRESQGLSIYFPIELKNMEGLSYYLNYINNICSNNDIKTLYYYKLAGCLNGELQTYAYSKGYGTFPVLDTTPLSMLTEADIQLSDNAQFHIPLDSSAVNLLQDMTFCLCQLDTENGMITYLGEDRLVFLNEQGILNTNFSGKWLSIDGQPLAVEVIDTTKERIRYRAPVLYNGTDSYLVIGYEYESGEFSVLGVYDMTSYKEGGDTLMRNTQNVEPGDAIQVIYETSQSTGSTNEKIYGKKFIYRVSSKVGEQILPDGGYLAMVALSDSRGDYYYTPIVNFEIQTGRVHNANLSDMHAITVAK